MQEEGAVAKGPFLDIGGSYETGHTLQELIDSGKISPLFSELEPVEKNLPANSSWIVLSISIRKQHL